MSKNKKLIRLLKRERRELYPYGMPIRPRGCGKIYLYLSHFIKYVAYDFACNTYKNADREVSIDEAHKYMDIFIEEIWQAIS